MKEVSELVNQTGKLSVQLSVAKKSTQSKLKSSIGNVVVTGICNAAEFFDNMDFGQQFYT